MPPPVITPIATPVNAPVNILLVKHIPPSVNTPAKYMPSLIDTPVVTPIIIIVNTLSKTPVNTLVKYTLPSVNTLTKYTLLTINAPSNTLVVTLAKYNIVSYFLLSYIISKSISLVYTNN